LRAARPFAVRPGSRRTRGSASRNATTWRPLLGGRGWPTCLHYGQGVYQSLCVCGLADVALPGVVGWFRCKRWTALFWALRSAMGPMRAPDHVLPLSRPIVPGNVKMRFCLLCLVCKVCKQRVAHRVAVHAWWKHPDSPMARVAHVRDGGARRPTAPFR
jgi:hypothetical protein